jgi:DNA invertase Pin-like site-specific DNA recombinase/transposase
MSKHAHRPAALPAVKSVPFDALASTRLPEPAAQKTLAAPGALMRTFFAYSRYSSAAQDPSSITRQHTTIERYVEGLGPCRIVFFDEEGLSAANADRPVLQKLLDLVRAGKVKYVVVEDFDRWSREIYDAVPIFELLEKHGVQFHSASEERVLSKIDVVTAAARAERDRLRRRNLSMSGLDSLVDAGGVPNTPGYGYRRTEIAGFPEVDQHEAKAILLMAAMLASGVPSDGVAALLEEEGYLSPTGRTKWNSATVIAIIGNPLLVGQIAYRRTTKRADERGGKLKTSRRAHHEIKRGFNARYRILSDAAYVAANQALRAKAKCGSNRNPQRSFPWLTGPVGCDCPGMEHHSFSRHALQKNGREIVKYRCGNQRKCRSHAKSIDAGVIDAAVLDAVGEKLAQIVGEGDFAAECIRRRREHEEERKARVANIEAELRAKGEMADRILEKELRHGIDDRLSELRHKVESEIAELQASLDRIVTPIPLVDATKVNLMEELTALKACLPLRAASEPEARFATAMRNIVPAMRIERRQLPIGQVRLVMSVDMGAAFTPLESGVRDGPHETVTKVIPARMGSVNTYMIARAADAAVLSGEHRLDDRRWGLIEPLIPDVAEGDPSGVTTRAVVDAAIFCMKTAIPISRPPAAFGPPHRLYALIQRLAYHGGLDTLVRVLGEDEPAWSADLAPERLARLKRAKRQSEYAIAAAARAAAAGKYALTDEQWRTSAPEIDAIVAGVDPDDADDPRKVVDAAICALRTRISWNRVPSHYGDPARVRRAIVRLVYTGSWARLISVWGRSHPELLDGLPVERMLGRKVRERLALQTAPALGAIAADRVGRRRVQSVSPTPPARRGKPQAGRGRSGA